MPAVVVELPPGSLNLARKKTTIAGYAGTVTLDIARPELDLAGLADSWEETTVAAGKGVLERTGKRLRTVHMTGLFTGERGSTASGESGAVDGQILVLVGLASPLRVDQVVAVTYDALLSQLTRSGGWVITDLSIKSLRRRASDNAIVRAEVDLTLTESARPPMPAQPAAATSPVAVAAAPASRVAGTPISSAPVTRFYTYTSADTLYRVAARLLGNGNLWPAIAEANGIRDPRRVPAGTVLTIPAT